MALTMSIKGVLFVEGQAVLLKNERDEWELPGGRMDADETPVQALVREFKEELSIHVEPTIELDSYVFEVVPEKFVSIVTYGCRLHGEFSPRISNEHTAVGLHPLADLERLPLPEGYRRSILSWSQHANP